MAKALLNGINVHYQMKGEGPDVVLIHGITSTLAFWYTQILPTLTKNYRVIMYDLRGHGYTDITETGYTSREMAEDLLALLDHLQVPRARLVGHSFGGSIGLHLALLHPERVDGVVLADSGIASLRRLRTIQDWPGWEMYRDQLTAHGITYEWFVEAEADDVTDVIRKSFEIPQQFGIRKGGTRESPRLRKLVDETRMPAEFRQVAGLTEERLAEIASPVLAVYGETSPYRNMAAHLLGLLPHYRCEFIAGAGHFYMLHATEIFLQKIAGFLADPAGNVAKEKTPGMNIAATREPVQEP